MNSRRPFKQYLSKVLVESGSYLGDGIREALDVGFDQVHSFEVAKPLYDGCVERFKENPRVHLHFCSSVKMMEHIGSIDEKMTFWLDGHYSYDGHTSFEEKVCPIIEELEAIKKHSRNDHTILIDDLRLFGTSEFDFISIEDVKKKLYEINQKYTIKYVSGIKDNDILVAEYVC